MVYARDMSHHAFYIVAAKEEGVSRALTYAQSDLGMEVSNNPDIVTLSHGLFSVDDARRVVRHASQTGSGGKKLIIVSAERIFHEAQNALLKIFEEPPEGTTLILIIPSAGVMLATLRSRLLELPMSLHDGEVGENVTAFIQGTPAEKEKIVAKLLERTKSEKEEEKQAARGDALRLLEGLTLLVHTAWRKKPTEELTLFLKDANTFIPILHERSAPLKLIFEHVLLTFPENLVV